MLFVGCVNYIDYNKEIIPSNNTFFPCIHKRKSFEHERELRAVITPIIIITGSNGVKRPTLTLKPLPTDGVYIPVDIDNLIETIYVSPTCERWFEDLVLSILKTYHIKKPVIKSSLADDPII